MYRSRVLSSTLIANINKMEIYFTCIQMRMELYEKEQYNFEKLEGFNSFVVVQFMNLFVNEIK